MPRLPENVAKNLKNQKAKDYYEDLLNGMRVGIRYTDGYHNNDSCGPHYEYRHQQAWKDPEDLAFWDYYYKNLICEVNDDTETLKYKRNRICRCFRERLEEDEYNRNIREHRHYNTDPLHQAFTNVAKRECDQCINHLTAKPPKLKEQRQMQPESHAVKVGKAREAARSEVDLSQNKLNVLHRDARMKHKVFEAKELERETRLTINEIKKSIAKNLKRMQADLYLPNEDTFADDVREILYEESSIIRSLENGTFNPPLDKNLWDHELSSAFNQIKRKWPIKQAYLTPKGYYSYLPPPPHIDKVGIWVRERK